MAKLVSKGKCLFCKSLIAKSGITRHLQSCKKRKESKGRKKRYFHIVIEGAYNPEYWLHIEAASTSKLLGLDQFLRDIWLECCGHLSMFAINGTRYSIDPSSDFDEKSMNTTLGKVLEKGMKFSYEYDFGSTTELKLRVINEKEICGRKGLITILARNEAPKILCDCGKKATQICTQCIYEGEGWLCGKCAKKHECGEEMCLPVVNSPRTGVCGYSG